MLSVTAADPRGAHSAQPDGGFRAYGKRPVPGVTDESLWHVPRYRHAGELQDARSEPQRGRGVWPGGKMTKIAASRMLPLLFLREVLAL